ncbi:putative histidinol aminotransferase [Pelagophyceae sp. CCMP2097]|nr:putative histidinol aminotransferase [Pelagophyceae sp. CCMP2097]
MMLLSSMLQRCARRRALAARTIITGPRFTPIVQQLPAMVPFIAPEEQERVRGRPFAVRLGANESTFGPSPKAVEAIQAAATESWKYGDPKSFELRTELAARHGCSMDNIVVGEGIDGLLSILAGLVVAPGDAVVSSHGTYPTLNFFVAGRGGVLHTVPYTPDGHVDLKALCAKAHEVDAKILYVVNPDNPSGTWRSAAAIEACLEDLPQGCLFVLDEAYVELCEAPPPHVAVDDLRALRLRTFSKGYGLAGARIGYAIASPGVIAQFCKLRNHFGVNKLAQAGALAALRDDAHLDRVRAGVRAGRARLEKIAAGQGLKCLPSATNFVSIDCGRDAGFARKVLAELAELDVFVRMPGAAPLDVCIRVAASTDPDIDVFEAAFAKALDIAKGRGADER